MAKVSRFILVCAIAAAAQAQTFSALHTFQYFPHGASPYAPVRRDPNTGDIYGTTNGGGPYNGGVVFKLDSAGGLTVLHTFTGGADGGNPCAGLVADSVGNLYGTTYQGGIAGAGVNELGAGVVFKIGTSGLFTVLYSFTGGADGSGPVAGVILDSARNLYGTTYYGGSSGKGVVYKINPAGQERALYSFKGAPDGANPYAGVTMDDNGTLYGTTYSGGGGLGAIYKLTAAGGEAVLFNFDGARSAASLPITGVILDASGNIYGSAGGAVYELDAAGTFTTLYQFTYNERVSGLTRDSSGNFYITLGAAEGPANNPYGAVFKLTTSREIRRLYQFNGPTVISGTWPPISDTDGANASVILDLAGNLYGTTPFQGTAGIVYEIEASGKVQGLYAFPPSIGGTNPWAGLTLDAAGSLYGTTQHGGGPANAGVVFEISPAGKETVVYTFKGGTADGAEPLTGVVLDAAGNVYGTTSKGGAHNWGTVYTLTRSGQESILHSFTDGADGGNPTGIAVDAAGNLYGTASAGGTGSQTDAQEGVVFEIDAAGNFSVLYSFTGLSDGGVPDGGVVLDSAGRIYGTTIYGGAGGGVIFRIDTAGAYSVLHTFQGSDGEYPFAGVTLDRGGNVYGTCEAGGPEGWGTIYKLTPAGDFSVVFAFEEGPAGSGSPMGGVAVDKAGNLYGALTAGPGYPGGPPGSYGQVYEIDTSGTETVLYSFTGGADGADTVASPVALDGSGHLYGVATGIFFTPISGGVAFRLTLP
jgi:uncharacterized repeat protein (TIGR03803 family)